MSTVAVVVPIYQAKPSEIEQFSLRHSLAQLKPGRTVFFTGPEGLDFAWYAEQFPGVPLITFKPEAFGSIKGYNRLLMSPDFYERFAPHEFILILQTDAILLRDELDNWTALPYDYVGAPWPDGVEILVNLDNFANSPGGKKVKVHVGNGGLSLRRNQACIDLLTEFPQAIDFFLRSGSSEDLFFSIMGSLSQQFLIPNEMVAARFALELKPDHYHRIQAQRPPMGGHAWWKYQPDFWLSLLGEKAQAIAPLLNR
ncbi:MAG: DUF5672 family protein [Pseudomonadota bacterium]